MSSISRRAALAALAAFTSVRAAHANAPLRIVYPYPAGGAGDTVARLFAEQLQVTLSRSVIVENKTGAGGRLGVIAVKDAPPDGNTLLFTATGQLAIQPHVANNVGYDPFTDLRPISEVARTEIALAVSGQLPITTLGELKQWLTSNPDKASYATPGAGTSAHFAGMALARDLGIAMNHVSYRGAPAALPDVVAGRIPLLFAISAEVLEQHRSGSVRIIAVAAEKRSPVLPDVPTFRDCNVDIVAPTGFSFHAARGLPAEFVIRFEQAISAACAVASVKQRIETMGLLPVFSSSAELGRDLRAQSDRWAAVVKASGFKPE